MTLKELRVLVSGLALLGAASIGAVTTTTASAESAAVPVAVSISATHVVTLPATIQPGVNEFTVTTEAKKSGFQLLQLAEGYSLDQARSDIEKGLERGKMKPFKRFEANVTLLGGANISAGDTGTVTLNLAAGVYYAADIETNKPSAFTQFTVAGVDTGAAMPAGSTIKATKDTSWAKNPKKIARKGMLTFKNFSASNHFVELVKFKKGKGIKDFKAWIQGAMSGGPGGPPPVQMSKSFDSAVVSPGQTVAMNYKLPAGKYVLVCFWPDADMGGMPHAFMGMYRAITLK